MATSLAEIRARLQANEGRTGKNQSSGSDNAIYAHWNIPENASTKVRFLPDADSKNTFFWIERAMIKLPFAGIKGQSDSKPVTIQVPCVEMWGEACPILAEVRVWFKDPALEDMGRKYWKKKSYLFQGFVRENALSDDAAPENPIRRFVISPQIFNIVKSALMDTEMEEMPTDYTRGLDFTISKTSKGGYSDYNTSKWARKETALNAAEHEAVDKFGLYNLADFLPKKPNEVELKVIKEMFEASVDGEPYDAVRWAAYYKPYGLKTDGTAPAAHGITDDDIPAFTRAAAPVVDDEDLAPVTYVAAPAPAGGNKKAEDILAMIRSRQK